MAEASAAATAALEFVAKAIGEIGRAFSEAFLPVVKSLGEVLFAFAHAYQEVAAAEVRRRLEAAREDRFYAAAIDHWEAEGGALGLAPIR